LLALLATAACGGSTDVQPSGAGGSSSGSAGTSGAAGTSGSAGTTGAGATGGASAGTSGSAGSTATGTAGNGATTGSAGTTGAAGRGGTTGAAGTTGTAGAGGRGGTTGVAGTTGTAGAGGRGGTTGMAGTTGRGGTTGIAGVSGGGGAGGCMITATSMLGTIPTVGIVTFTTNLTGITGAEIRFGPASSGPTMTAPVDLAQPSYRTLLLGMKGSTSYVYRVVITSGAGTCTSPDYTIMTGAVPTSAPKPTTTIMNAAAHFKGFMVTSSGTMGSGAWIFDADGAPVWWSTGPSGTSRIQMSWDGKKMYLMALNVQNTSAGAVNIINMDGSGSTMAAGMAAAHHDMTAIPGGFATLLWNTTGTDAPCSLVERADDGTMKTIVADMTALYSTSNGRYHTNSIHYYPGDNTYTLGDRNPNAYVHITRTGTLLWQFGGGSPKDQSKFFSGVPTWMVNHGHHMLPDGSFILFNNGSMSGGSSAARVFKLNTTNMTATSTLTYMASGVSSNVMGDAQFLPNGNILVTFSQSGMIHEITSSGQLVASFKSAANPSTFGYTEYRDSLYGAPPR
jgi:hypothetical protein